MKIGRNDKCLCGSGLKYKKCCGNNAKKDNIDSFINIDDTSKRTIINILKTISNSKKIADKDGFYRILGGENIEKVNPIAYYKEIEVLSRAISFRDLSGLKHPIETANMSFDFFINFAENTLMEEKFWEIKEQTEIPDNLLKLLETNRKKDQISLLKGMSFNPDQLLKLIFISYEKYGYLYSKYVFENLPNGIEKSTKPKLAHISTDGTVNKIGETNLSDGQIKNMIEHRKVIVSHFFDKGDDWHCLFTTHSSLGGKENWKDGQAHFHYISSAFGITRKEFLESMKNGQYKSTSIHIDLLDYGHQTITKEKNDG